MDRAAGLQGLILRGLTRVKAMVLVCVAVVVGMGLYAGMHAGREFFPRTDAGLIRLFVRLPSGGRVEDTGRTLAEIERAIRDLVPANELQFVVANIGAPSPINQAWVPTASVSSSDSEIMVQLADGHAPSHLYESRIREMMSEKHPEAQMFFRPADATSQTLASGAAATFEVRFIGRDTATNLTLANELIGRFSKVDGAVDVTLREVLDQPRYTISIDRVRAATLGITQQDASSAVLNALGSGGTVSPAVWADPNAGTSYDVQVIAPPAVLTSVEQLLNLPVRPSASSGDPVPLRAFATLVETRSPASVSRTTLQPTLTVVANTTSNDLGAVTAGLEEILSDLRTRQKPGNSIVLAGQAALMQSAYRELIGGLGLAAVLVFLVMVVNFQSWLLPLVAISGLPIAISGALCALWLVGTPLSVPALMGIILVVGVSTANSVLVTSFARDLFASGTGAREAAIHSATTRLRPVMMTALAMILGVVPMAIGQAEGGEQNAPLGRAVIGGLLFGTLASLFVVPIVFDFVCSRMRRRTGVPNGEPPATAAMRSPPRALISLNAAQAGAPGNGHLPHDNTVSNRT